MSTRLGRAYLAFLLAGCSGAPADVKAPEPDGLPAARLAEAWPVKFATQADLEAVSSEGWQALVNKHDYAASLASVGEGGGLAAARAHAETAALYSQAALLEANSLIQTYGKSPEPTDPVGVAHLLAVSYALTGDLASAKEWSAKVPSADPTAPWNAPWATWLASADPPVWPPDLSTLPLHLDPPKPGGWPDAGALPHYILPEQGEGAHSREMGDPGALVALALWHEAAADAAAGEQKPAISSWLAQYRLPIEPMDAPVALPAELMFGSELLVPEDAAFMADLRAKGVAAVDAWREKSLVAELAVRSRGPDGKIDPLLAADQLAALREALLAAESARTDQTVQSFQRTFANIASVGATRCLALVAEADGDRETAGRLRIAAMERSDKETANPEGLLALAAWDAGNRYPMRAQEILHAHLTRFPALEVARYGLDVLALRVSRERPGETAGM